MKVFYDQDVDRLDIPEVAIALRGCLERASRDAGVAPPRTAIKLGGDTVAITAGTSDTSFGFRAYSYRQGLARDSEDQAVLCWDAQTHDLKAIALGDRVGAWRTGILGGIAYQTLVRGNVQVCGLIGTDRQAYTQARAIAALRPPEAFLVYGRDPDRRRAFVDRLQQETGIPTTECECAEEVACNCDALILATRAAAPVIQRKWLNRCQHITTVGPKTKDRHELPVDISSWADLVTTDSPQQIASQGADHFLAGVVNTSDIVHLGDILPRRPVPDLRRTLYLSAGLAGTEVALLQVFADQLRDGD